jgi:predicted lipid-binding transport protein (Tim44 family)
MTGSDAEASTEDASTPPWRLLGVGGALSLCCLFAAPAAGAAAAGGTAATLGGGLIRILVTVLAVGLIGAVYRVRSFGCACSTQDDSEP